MQRRLGVTGDGSLLGCIKEESSNRISIVNYKTRALSFSEGAGIREEKQYARRIF
jgi:hypothetical protein